MTRKSNQIAVPTAIAVLLGGLLLIFEAAAPARSTAGAAPASVGHDDQGADQSARSDALPAGQAMLDYVETLKPAVISVIATNDEGVDVASGSGFIVGENRVITNHQVVARGTKARVVLNDGSEARIRAVAAHDTRINLALLEVAFTDEIKESLRKPAPLAEADPRKDQEVLLITNPIGRQHIIALGTVHGIEERPDLPPIVRMQTRYSTASTGSPVFNGRGEVVGAAVYAHLDGSSQKFTIPATAVRAFIDSADDTVPVSLVDYHTSMASTLSDSAAAGEIERLRPEDVQIEATIVTQEDGSILIDDRYVVRGSGTRQDPYRITWDLLVSASRVYQPREGLDRLPERITFLHDKWVTVTGFVAFPLMTQEADELLLMLNQWDGCCIGIPPTPYDAVEVTLRNKVPAEAGINIFNYGAVTGRFKVDPYVVNRWLVGLYMMEDAVLRLEM